MQLLMAWSLLCRLGWPRTYHVVQAAFEFTVIIFFLLTKYF